MKNPDAAAIAQALMVLAQARGVHKTFCPPEAARALSLPDWRNLMPEVRRVAADLPLLVPQKGRPLIHEPCAGRSASVSQRLAEGATFGLSDRNLCATITS